MPNGWRRRLSERRGDGVCHGHINHAAGIQQLLDFGYPGRIYPVNPRVEEVLGLGQGNVISGAFSNPLALAFKIEHGEIVGRVKDLSIAGNVYDLLKDVAAVSRETRWVYGSFCLPYLLLPEMNVIAKE